VDVVNRIVPELIRSGRVPTPGIGIIAASETVATRLGVEGVVVIQVAPGSPADRSGIRGLDATTGALGEVIVEINGKPVRMLSDLTDAIEQGARAGSTRRNRPEACGSQRQHAAPQRSVVSCEPLPRFFAVH